MTHVLQKLIFHGLDQDIKFDRKEIPQEIIHLFTYELHLILFFFFFDFILCLLVFFLKQHMAH